MEELVVKGGISVGLFKYGMHREEVERYMGYYIEDYGDNAYGFNAVFTDDSQAAMKAVEEYRQILLACGFRQAGQYPTIEQLYKRIDGIVYNVDTEHCFEGDPDCACIGFCVREPHGGFDYVKPEPKKKFSLKDLF